MTGPGTPPRLGVSRGKLEGLLVLAPPRVFADERGFFAETYRDVEWSEAGLPPFVQDNHSRSVRGVVRGIHFSTARQGKLVRCARGRIWDVAVDLRRSSPTFLRWEANELDDEHHAQVYIPPGLGHGFAVLSDVADVTYKLTSNYDPATEMVLAWDDPEVGIGWPVREPILSRRDAAAPALREILDRLPG